MKKIIYSPLILIWGLMGIALPLRGEDIILYQGPPVSTPESTPVTPFPEKGSPKLIKFQREFYITQDLIAALPEPSSEFETIPVTAVEAIQLAMKDIDPDHELRSLIVTDVKLMRGPTNSKRKIEYYLVSAMANHSEAHRIVLMNRQVISSKLREITEE